MIQYSAKSIREAKDVLSVFVHLGIEYNAFLDHPGDKGTITVKQESEWLFAAAPDLLAACEAAFEFIETARRYFPKSVKNQDTFKLETTCATLGTAIAKAKKV